jgi:hypothetical protein
MHALLKVYVGILIKQLVLSPHLNYDYQTESQLKHVLSTVMTSEQSEVVVCCNLSERLVCV